MPSSIRCLGQHFAYTLLLLFQAFVGTVAVHTPADAQEMMRGRGMQDGMRGGGGMGIGIGTGIGVGIGIANEIGQQRSGAAQQSDGPRRSYRGHSQSKQTKRAAKKPEDEKGGSTTPGAGGGKGTPKTGPGETGDPSRGDVTDPRFPRTLPKTEPPYTPVPGTAATPPTMPLPEYHGYTHALTCGGCADTCKANTSNPACKFGDTKNRKETVIKRIVLANGNGWAKVQYDEDVCNTVTCREYLSNRACCSYNQWQAHSYTLWTTEGKDSGGKVTYTPDVSVPCTCGQLLEMAQDLGLSSELDKGSAFIDMAKKRCPGLGLADAQKMAQSCGFGPDMKEAMKFNFNDFINRLIGMARLGNPTPVTPGPPPSSTPVPARDK